MQSTRQLDLSPISLLSPTPPTFGCSLTLSLTYLVPLRAKFAIPKPSAKKFTKNKSPSSWGQPCGRGVADVGRVAQRGAALCRHFLLRDFRDGEGDETRWRRTKCETERREIYSTARLRLFGFFGAHKYCTTTGTRTYIIHIHIYLYWIFSNVWISGYAAAYRASRTGFVNFLKLRQTIVGAMFAAFVIASCHFCTLNKFRLG